MFLLWKLEKFERRPKRDLKLFEPSRSGWAEAELHLLEGRGHEDER